MTPTAQTTKQPMSWRGRRYSTATSTETAPPPVRGAQSAPIVSAFEFDVPSSRRGSPSAIRKRHSFFSRSSTGTANDGAAPTLHATMSSQNGRPRSPPTRPSTSMSGRVRSKTEPLESFRNSIFGGRKKTASQQDRRIESSRLQSRSGASSQPEATYSREHFDTEDDCKSKGPGCPRSQADRTGYRYLRKSSISPPFNFQHVTHTKRNQLPKLETVDESDLKAEFWSASAYQRPRRHLNGIKADDLDEKHRQLGISRGSPSSRPSSPIPVELPTERPRLASPLGQATSSDETVFDEERDTRFNPDAASRALHTTGSPTRFPRRYSSLGALKEQSPQASHRSPDTFYESSSSHEGNAGAACDHIQAAQITQIGVASSPVADRIRDQANRLSQSYSYRARQPLPPLPPQAPLNKPSKSSPKPERAANVSTPSLAAAESIHASPKSKRSSHSTKIASPATCSTPDLRRPSTIWDTTWEDDVDFCYEQEAESTCDFDWDGAMTLHRQSVESDGGVRLSSYAPSVANGLSRDTTGLARNASDKNECGTKTERLSSQLRSRSSVSVGHRGFLQARNSSVDLSGSKRSSGPPHLEWTPSSTQVSILSPVFSVLDKTETTPTTPLSPDAKHFPRFEATNNDYLSDPESCLTGGSRHRKSSSYGSYESFARPAAAKTETGRWSIASSTSVPELMHSRRKSRQSVQKGMISQPLESLPQSPNQSDGSREEDSTIVPRSLRTGPVRNTFVMRRPQTPEDRTTLQAAGRAVQRGRPPTPNRFSRLLSGAEPSGQQPPVGETTWI